MAKASLIQRNLRRLKLASSHSNRRNALKTIVMNKTIPLEERFGAQLKLAAMPRNSSKIRQRNRCIITGRPRGYYRKFGLSRIAFRELASAGMIPGVTKSSW